MTERQLTEIDDSALANIMGGGANDAPLVGGPFDGAADLANQLRNANGRAPAVSDGLAGWAQRADDLQKAPAWITERLNRAADQARECRLRLSPR